MKLNFSKYKLIFIILLCIILLLPSLFLTLFSLNFVVEAASDSASDDTDNWLKGVLLILLSFVINNNVKDEPESRGESSQIGDKPLVEENNNLDKSKKEVLGFYVNWLTKYANSYDSYEKNSNNIDMVAPFWYTLNPDGSIENRYGGHQYEVTSLAQKTNTKVLPLINNNQQNNMILVNPEIRKKAINNIVKLINNNNYDGINIDFEYLPSWTRDGYTSFIKELGEKLNKQDKLLTVSVFPKINVPLSIHGTYDYEAIEPYIDRLVMMTYDFHWSSGSPGAIAPIKWVEDNIKYALEYISNDKLMIGIANYGYDWTTNSTGKDLSAKKAFKIAENNGAEIKWDNNTQTPYFNYYKENKTHEVWFENSYSIKHKLDLVNKYNLKGIGIWRLGNSEKRFWQIIEESF